MADDDKLIREIRDRMNRELENHKEQKEVELEDLLFLEGKNHWPPTMAGEHGERTKDGRPCLTINKLPAFVDQVSGDLRLNLPAIKIKPVDSDADPDTAEVLTGMIRAIQNQSSGDVAVLTAADSAVRCGRGSYRIITEYESDQTFDQIIKLKRIKNHFTVLWDSTAQEHDKSDARFCIVWEKMPKDEFEKKYPDASGEFPGDRDRDSDWDEKDTMRVAEYFRVVKTEKTLYLLRDQETGEEFVRNEKFEGLEVVNKRKVEQKHIEWYKTNGSEILEGPIVLPGKYIPIVDVYGKELHIENRTIYRGIVRNSKDSQRLYNYSRSHHAEQTALAPKIPVFVTAKMIANNQHQWNTMHKKNWPFIVFEPDELAPQGPQRPPPIPSNPSALAEVQIADQELHDTSGMQLASLGKASNEKSGRAIQARKQEGDRGNVEFLGNVARARRWEGKILVDLIPKIYDTERVVQIMGEDGTQESVTINGPQIDQATGQPKINPKTQRPKVVDLNVGTYDAVVSTGPSYDTQREEAADAMVQFYSILPPQHQAVTADLIPKNLDWPGADTWEERLKATLPPGLADPDGPPPPPPPPDPIQMLTAEKLKAEVEKGLIEVQKTKAEIEKLLIENRLKRNEVAEKEIEPDDLNTRKTQAEIDKIYADIAAQRRQATEPRQ